MKNVFQNSSTLRELPQVLWKNPAAAICLAALFVMGNQYYKSKSWLEQYYSRMKEMDSLPILDPNSTISLLAKDAFCEAKYEGARIIVEVDDKRMTLSCPTIK